MEVSERHARTRAIIRDTDSPANWLVAGGGDASRDVARVVSDVSVLCPRTVDEGDNIDSRASSPPPGVRGRPLTRQATLTSGSSASTVKRASLNSAAIEAVDAVAIVI
jgi:hypothetical protein